MTSTQSKACCTVPPVVAEGYKEKGEYLTIEGMKTYATQVTPTIISHLPNTSTHSNLI